MNMSPIFTPDLYLALFGLAAASMIVRALARAYARERTYARARRVRVPIHHLYKKAI